jgi:hypothetical protein
MVWLGLIGAVLLAAAGVLATVRMVRLAGPEADPASASPVSASPDLASPDLAAPDLASPAFASPVVATLAGVAGLLAAALAVVAFLLPPLDAGGLESLLVLSAGSPVPGATLFVAAAVPLAVAAVLALVPPTAAAGRAALMVVWVAVVPAVTVVLESLGDDGISTARLMGLVSIGSGTWCGIAALVVAAAAAVLAAVTARRIAQASTSVADDESVAAARKITVPIAIGLGVLALVASCLPVYGTAGQLQGPTVLRGYAVQAWGVWAALIVTVAAVGAAAVTRSRWGALAAGLAAAAVQAMRLVVPQGVTHASGFGLRPGAVVQAVLVLALIVGGVLLAVRAGGVRDLDAVGVAAGGGDGPRLRSGQTAPAVRARPSENASSVQSPRARSGPDTPGAGKDAARGAARRPASPSRRKRR